MNKNNITSLLGSAFTIQNKQGGYMFIIWILFMGQFRLEECRKDAYSTLFSLSVGWERSTYGKLKAEYCENPVIVEIIGRK